MDLGLAGKWALVCGASRGLGLGCAQALAAEGVNTVMVARGAESLNESATKIIAACARIHWPEGTFDAQNKPFQAILTVPADITTESGRAAVFAVRQDFDIVVTNAGGPPPGDFRNWQRDDWIKALDANMLAPIALMKAVVDGMAARGFGRVVNITSSAVKAPIDILGLSNGARSGLTGFAAGLARSPALASKGVTINNLLPGAFDTDRLRATLAGSAQKSGQTLDAVLAARQAGIPARRFGNAAEFGQICAFLCSQQAGYITGQNILADGGAFAGAF